MSETVFKDVGLLVSQADGKVVPAVYRSCDFQTYGVKIGEYDMSKTLIVDPLIFSTYQGDMR